MGVEKFNIRVYGLLIHQEKVLVTHEKRGGMLMTKFPGGGLERGEGIADCLIREFQEELSIQIETADIFYVNDFLQISAFNPKDQLISFYYLVTTSEIEKIDESSELDEFADDDQIFEWVNIRDLNPEDFTFPIDKIVSEHLCQSF